MKKRYVDAPVPRNGHKLIVGIMARISGCQNQKEMSLEDQEDHAKDTIREIYDGPVDFRVIATTGKGERFDRPELAQIQAELRTSKLDFLVVEDLGRLVRGAEAIRLLGIAVDHGTRVLSPNDGIDTAEDTWEEDALSACRDHVGHNVHTSKRIKQKSMNRFVSWGERTTSHLWVHQATWGEDVRRLANQSSGDADLPGMVSAFARIPIARRLRIGSMNREFQPANTAGLANGKESWCHASHETRCSRECLAAAGVNRKSTMKPANADRKRTPMGRTSILVPIWPISIQQSSMPRLRCWINAISAFVASW